MRPKSANRWAPAGKVALEQRSRLGSSSCSGAGILRRASSAQLRRGWRKGAGYAEAGAGAHPLSASATVDSVAAAPAPVLGSGGLPASCARASTAANHDDIEYNSVVSYTSPLATRKGSESRRGLRGRRCRSRRRKPVLIHPRHLRGRGRALPVAPTARRCGRLEVELLACGSDQPDRRLSIEATSAALSGVSARALSGGTPITLGPGGRDGS